MEVTHKPLALVLRNNGYAMRQVYRQGDYAIYSKGAGYETIRIRRHNGFKIKGYVVEPAEYAPSDSEFGNHGFYFFGPNALELAHQRLKEMRDKDAR